MSLPHELARSFQLGQEILDLLNRRKVTLREAQRLARFALRHWPHYTQLGDVREHLAKEAKAKVSP